MGFKGVGTYIITVPYECGNFVQTLNYNQIKTLVVGIQESGWKVLDTSEPAGDKPGDWWVRVDGEHIMLRGVHRVMKDAGIDIWLNKIVDLPALKKKS
jgi:hypothetical protein